MKKFKKLFWLIFTEHTFVQIAMYSVMFLVPLFVFMYNGYEIYDALILSIILPAGMKTLSLLSSLASTWLIIKKCKADDPVYKEIYKEWTGETFNP